MRVEQSLTHTRVGMILSAGFAFAAFLVAKHFHSYGGFLASLAVFSAALFSIISVSMFAVMAGTYCLVLLRQPDDVSPEGMGEGTIYRDRRNGAIVYQNMAAISDLGMVVCSSDHAAPRMRHEPSVVQDNRQGVYEMPDLEIFEGSIEELFCQGGGNGQ